MLRRSFCSAALALTVPCGHADNKCDQKANGRREWLACFYETQSREAIGPLRLQKFPDDMYIVLEPISWKPSAGQPSNLPSVTVPFGFVTDLASIPTILFSLLRPDGPYGFAAIIHDYLYWEKTYPKEAADRVFDFAMRDFKISTPVRTSIIAGVKSYFGDRAWRENTRLRKSGERRLLKSVPLDPTITWQDWKKRPEVFAVAHSPNTPPTAAWSRITLA